MDELADAFQSARLQYVGINPDDAALKKFLPQVVNEPIIQAMSSSTMLRPKTKRDFEDTIKWVSDSLLGVAICLKNDAESASTTPQNDKIRDSEEEPVVEEHGEIIGIMGINYAKYSVTATHHRTAEIGLSLSTQHQGKGYGREALNWMLDWGFNHAGLHTISILAASYNPRALHLYESIGFVVEGRRRETIWQNRKWHDLVEFGMTEAEWEALRAAPASK